MVKCMRRKSIKAAWGHARHFWHLWGWVEGQFGRLTFLLVVIGVLLWVGAVFTAWAEQSPATVVYVVALFVPIGLLLAGVWGAVGIRALRTRTPLQPASAPARRSRALLRVTTFVTNDRKSARLQVANVGPAGTFALEVHEIVGIDDGPRTQPYSARWLLPPSKILASRQLDLNMSETLGVGDIRDIELARVQVETGRGTFMVFPQAGDLQQNDRIEGKEWWGLKTRWRSSLQIDLKHAYVVATDDRKRITDFFELSWDELSERAD